MFHPGSYVCLFIAIFLLLTSCDKSGEKGISKNGMNAVSEGPENGTLIIMGGSARAPVFMETFMKLAGGPEAPIVVIPTAMGDESIENDPGFVKYRQRYLDAGFTNVTVLHTRDPKDSDNDEFITPIKTANGIWFSGGRQWRHADSYLGTRAHEEFRKVLERGGVIAGSSAGATIQGSYLARGDTQANTIMMGDHEEGLSFISNIAIDQHLFARNRQFDMFEILENRPELLGIGLDENTGIIVRGNRFEVIGVSYVAVYDGTRWSAERDTIYQLADGSQQFYLLNAGDEYDLKDRKVVLNEDRIPISLNPGELRALTGSYANDSDDRKMQVKVVNDTLTVTRSWNDNETKLLPESSSVFFSPASSTLVVVFEMTNRKNAGFRFRGSNVYWKMEKPVSQAEITPGSGSD